MARIPDRVKQWAVLGSTEVLRKRLRLRARNRLLAALELEKAERWSYRDQLPPLRNHRGFRAEARDNDPLPSHSQCQSARPDRPGLAGLRQVARMSHGPVARRFGSPARFWCVPRAAPKRGDHARERSSLVARGQCGRQPSRDIGGRFLRPASLGDGVRVREHVSPLAHTPPLFVKLGSYVGSLLRKHTPEGSMATLVCPAAVAPVTPELRAEFSGTPSAEDVYGRHAA